jgi:hypothetical protein
MSIGKYLRIEKYRKKVGKYYINLYPKFFDICRCGKCNEMETFYLGDTTYTPDFFLPQFEKFIEIKGYMCKEAQEKINKFLEQYPWNLEILYKKDLINLGADL